MKLNLTTDEEENVSPFTGNPVAGGVAVKQEKRTSRLILKFGPSR